MPETDEITLTIPRDRDFQRVAHLVVGGLALRLDLTIETLEDLQLALSTILDRVDSDGDITVSISLKGETVETSIGPIDLTDELAADDGLTMGRILRTVTDDFTIDGNYIRLTKKIASVAHG